MSEERTATTGFRRLGEAANMSQRFVELLTKDPDPVRRERLIHVFRSTVEQIRAGVPYDDLQLPDDSGPTGLNGSVCKCRGTGILIRPYDPEENAEPVYEDCPYCNAGRSETIYRQQRARGGSGLEDFRDVTFFSTRATMEQEAIWSYALDWSQDPGGILWLYGSSWTGKSTLARCIGNEWIMAGKPVLYWSEPDLMRDLRATYDRHHEGPAFDQVMRTIQTAPLLILDDFGKARSRRDPDTGQSWVAEKRFEITDYREARNLPTVFTSNLTRADLEADEDLARLAPRIFDSVRSQACDFRDVPYAKQTRRTPTGPESFQNPPVAPWNEGGPEDRTPRDPEGPL